MSSPGTTHLPATFNRLAWSNLAAQSAEQIALAAGPIVAVPSLGVGEGETGSLQTVLTLPFILIAMPAGLLADRISRRRPTAGAEALWSVALLAILLLIGLHPTLPLLSAAGSTAGRGRSSTAWRHPHRRFCERAGAGRLSRGLARGCARFCLLRSGPSVIAVLLMDEPCSALDPISTLAIEELISELKTRYTIVIVTHNMQQAARVSDRTAFFNLAGVGQPGRLIEYDDTARSSPTPRKSPPRTTSPAASADHRRGPLTARINVHSADEIVHFGPIRPITRRFVRADGIVHVGSPAPSPAGVYPRG